MANYCTKCGKPLPEGSQFCPECGAKVVESIEAPKTIKPDTAAKPKETAAQKKTETAKPKDTTSQTKPETVKPKDSASQSKPQTVKQVSGSVRAAAEKPNNTKKGRPFVSFLLVAVMIFELWAAAYKYPGFLKDKPTDPTPGNTTTTTATEEVTQPTTEKPEEPDYSMEDLLAMIEGVEEEDIGLELTATDDGKMVNHMGLEVTPENSPGNPAFIDVMVTEDMINRTEPAVIPVTPENPKVEYQGITVDFGEWNITEADALEIRPMGSQECEALDGTLTMYDFCLSSGKHEFPTGVSITVPRTAGENYSQIVTFNEETRQWEPLSFTVSEDGSTITYSKTHFSTDAEMIERRILWMNKKGFLKMETKREREVTYTDLLEPLYLDRKALRDYLELDDGFVDSILNKGGLDKTAMVSNAYDAGNSLVGGGDFLSTLNDLTKTVSANKVFTACLGRVAFVLSVGKIAYQVCKNRDKYVALKENALDIISAAGAGYALAFPSTTSKIVALVCFSIPIVASGISEASKEAYYEYRVYRDYLERGVVVTVNDKTFTLFRSGAGWDKAISEACMGVLNAGRTPDQCVQDLQDIYNQFTNNFFEFPYDTKNEIAQYNQYRLRYKKINAGDYSYTQDNNPGWKKWREPDDNTKAKWIQDFQSEMYKKTKDIIDKKVKLLVDACEQKLATEIENVILPYMNRMIDITVTDLSLPAEDQWFYNSPYANGSRVEKEENGTLVTEVFNLGNLNERAITFPDRSAIRFQVDPLPNNDKEFDMYVRKGTNTILRMRYFHYMQIGYPQKIRFAGNAAYDKDGKVVNPPIEKELNIPDVITPYLQVNITLNSDPELYELLITSMDEQRIVAGNDIPQMMLLDIIDHAELEKSGNGNFILTFAPSGTVDYDKAETKEFLGMDADDPDYRSTLIKYNMTDKSFINGRAPSKEEEKGTAKANIDVKGTAEVWEHMEYKYDGETLSYTAGIQQTMTLNIKGNGTAKSSTTTVPGKTGKYEVIEITLDLDAHCTATEGRVLQYTGPESGNPSVNDGEVNLQYNEMTLRFISKNPIPEVTEVAAP